MELQLGGESLSLDGMCATAACSGGVKHSCADRYGAYKARPHSYMEAFARAECAHGKPALSGTARALCVTAKDGVQTCQARG